MLFDSRPAPAGRNAAWWCVGCGCGGGGGGDCGVSAAGDGGSDGSCGGGGGGCVPRMPPLPLLQQPAPLPPPPSSSRGHHRARGCLRAARFRIKAATDKATRAMHACGSAGARSREQMRASGGCESERVRLCACVCDFVRAYVREHVLWQRAHQLTSAPAPVHVYRYEHSVPTSFTG